MNKKTILIALLVALLAAAAGTGGWWFFLRGAPDEKPKLAVVDYRFVSLDKIIVMLRSEASGEVSYMALDLVFRSSHEQEAKVKEQLPLLKSVAVRTLSQLTREGANRMNIDGYQQLLNKAYRATFAREGREQPFSEVMISKLIIE